MPDMRQPTAFEQLALEYINRMRLNPSAEFDAILSDGDASTQAGIAGALSYFGVDETALRAQFDALVEVAPVAWNANLAQAATDHSEAMRSADQQSHRLPGEEQLGDRITAAGYTNWSRVNENIFAYTQNSLYGHAGFAIDWGYDAQDFDGNTLLGNWQSLGDGIQDPAGHRDTIMDGRLTEVGIGAVEQTDPNASTGPFLMTQNFGSRWIYEAQLLGVVIYDIDEDGFYDIGEGIGGVTVTAVGNAGTFTTTSWESGGYQLALPEGDYTVSFSGGDLTVALQQSVTFGAANHKLDLVISVDQDANRLIGSPDNDILIGGDGAYDLVGQAGDDLLLGDGLPVHVTGDISAQVFRLYQATLGRAPDSTGHKDWVMRLYSGELDLSEAAARFVASAEFQTRYGSLDNTAFVELIYEYTLGRAADAEGLADWTERLEDGMSRPDLVLGFSESRELINKTAAAAEQFSEANSPQLWSDDVFRLYQAALDRSPDPGGFSGWTGQLGGGANYLDVVTGFVNSAEFNGRYGALENVAFIELLYENVLGRPSDPGGKADWLSRMEDGWSQAEVVRGFAQSGEFRNATAEPLEVWMRERTEDDVLVGGKGSDVLAGGIGADVFVFAPSDADDTGALDRVLDLEAWDWIDLTAFGFVDFEAAQAAFSQNGADAMFDAQAVSVVFEQTNLAMIDADMLLI